MQRPLLGLLDIGRLSQGTAEAGIGTEGSRLDHPAARLGVNQPNLVAHPLCHGAAVHTI